MPVPSDERLYEVVKRRIYKKYPKHSAYRSGLLVQAYKKSFKTKYGARKSPYIGVKNNSTGLKRWFRENWRSDRGKIGYSSKSSVYRPTKRITKDTPVTFGELTEKQIQRAKKEKARTGRVKKF